VIDQKKLDAMPETVQGPVEIEKLPLQDLLALRARVHAALPATRLVDLNLETEVIVQFLQVKALLQDVLTEGDTPANQKAQVANSCQAILDQLTKRQLQLYGTERVKAIEQCVIRCMKKLPDAAQRAFFEDYERTYMEAVGASQPQ
jgi:hypothetical protein